MRKIISILLALGVILGLSLMAAPVGAAAPVCPTDCTLTVDDVYPTAPPDFCAGGTSDYYITDIVLPVTLIPGTDSLSVDFPTGTDLTAVDETGVIVWDITSGAGPFSPAAITVTGGTHLEFVVPAGFLATFGLWVNDVIEIEVDGVVNPSTAGKACLYVDYKFACCPAAQFGCVQYTISPTIATLGFHFNFGAVPSMYPGIALDCIPPFKACGQEGYGHFEPGILPAGGWVSDFDLILTEDVPGCHPPCAAAKFWFVLTKAPTGETVTFMAPDGLVYTLVATGVPATTAVGKVKVLDTALPLPDPWGDITWPLWIHFSSPGDYEICFYLQCPAGVICPNCGGPTIVATKCLPAKAYQYKDAFKLELTEKWNLISLPLYPFDTKIESVLGCMGGLSQLQSVWYFGQCENPADNLGVWHTEVYDKTAKTWTGDVDNIVAGKAYWVRMLEPTETGYVAAEFPVSLWVWGTHAPMPPSSPMGYFDVCKGWNMVGFKAPWAAGVPIPETDWIAGVPTTGYLWNFNQILGGVHYGLIYDWVEGVPGDWTYWTPGTLSMLPGEGYWIPFDGNDQIYPAP